MKLQIGDSKKVDMEEKNGTTRVFHIYFKRKYVGAFGRIKGKQWIYFGSNEGLTIEYTDSKGNDVVLS